MAKRQKRFIKVQDNWVRQPWPRDVMPILVRLSVGLNMRWARDDLTTAECVFAALTDGELLDITGQKRFDRAAEAMVKCATATAETEQMHVATVRRGRIEVTCPAGEGRARHTDAPRCCRPVVERATRSGQARDTLVIVHWPKYAENQNLHGWQNLKPGSGKPPTQTQDADADADADEDADEDEDGNMRTAAGAAASPSSKSPVRSGNQPTLDLGGAEKPPAKKPKPEPRLTQFPYDLLDLDFATDLAEPENNGWGIQLDPKEVRCWLFWIFHTGLKLYDRTKVTRQNVRRMARSWWMRTATDRFGKPVPAKDALDVAIRYWIKVKVARQDAAGAKNESASIHELAAHDPFHDEVQTL